MTIVLPSLCRDDVGGGIRIAARVVERTAAQLALSVPGIGAPGTQVMGVGRQADFDRRPKLQAHIDGGAAYITIDCAIEYPRSIERTVDALRRVLTEQLVELTGVRVGRIDVRVRRVVAHLDAPRSLA